MESLYVSVSAKGGVRDLPNLTAATAAARLQAGDRIFLLSVALDGSLQSDEVTAGPAASPPSRQDVALSIGGTEIGVASIEVPPQGKPSAPPAHRLK